MTPLIAQITWGFRPKCILRHQQNLQSPSSVNPDKLALVDAASWAPGPYNIPIGSPSLIPAERGAGPRMQIVDE